MPTLSPCPIQVPPNFDGEPTTQPVAETAGYSADNTPLALDVDSVDIHKTLAIEVKLLMYLWEQSMPLCEILIANPVPGNVAPLAFETGVPAAAQILLSASSGIVLCSIYKSRGE